MSETATQTSATDTTADRSTDASTDATTEAATEQAVRAEQAVEAVQATRDARRPATSDVPGEPPREEAALGSAIGSDDREGGDERVMHDDIAAQWELWSMIIGRTAESRLKQIPQRIPTMTSAMLGTADGLNLCAVGIPRAEVGRLAALNSSLFAVSAAQAAIVTGHASEPGEAVVGLTTAHGSLVLVSFVRQPLGHLVLAVNASAVDLGTLVPTVREVAEDIREWLGTS